MTSGIRLPCVPPPPGPAPTPPAELRSVEEVVWAHRGNVGRQDRLDPSNGVQTRFPLPGRPCSPCLLSQPGDAARVAIAELFAQPSPHLRDISGLSGALTFAFSTSGRRFAVKTPGVPHARGCDAMRREHRLTRWASQHALGPPPIYFHHATGAMVTEWARGLPVTQMEVNEETFLRSLARLMQRLHQCEANEERTPMDPARRVALRFGQAAADGTIDAASADIVRQCLVPVEDAHQHLPAPCAMCHHDVNKENLFFDEGNLCLIDWEEAGLGNPIWDLAFASISLGLDDQASRCLHERYNAADEGGERSTYHADANYYCSLRALAAADFFLWEASGRSDAVAAATYLRLAESLSRAGAGPGVGATGGGGDG